MKPGFWIRRITLSAGLMAALAAHAAGDAAAGKWKADTCLGCHGIQNYFSVYPSYRVPKLAGQHGDYLVAALQDYRTGARKHPTMRANAGALSDQDIYDIAAYLSGEPVAPPPAPAAAEQAPQAQAPAVPPAAAAPAASTTDSAPAEPAEPAIPSKPQSTRKRRAGHARKDEANK
jgi:cytochrome c553